MQADIMSPTTSTSTTTTSPAGEKPTITLPQSFETEKESRCTTAGSDRIETGTLSTVSLDLTPRKPKSPYREKAAITTLKSSKSLDRMPRMPVSPFNNTSRRTLSEHAVDRIPRMPTSPCNSSSLRSLAEDASPHTLDMIPRMPVSPYSCASRKSMAECSNHSTDKVPRMPGSPFTNADRRSRRSSLDNRFVKRMSSRSLADSSGRWSSRSNNSLAENNCRWSNRSLAENLNSVAFPCPKTNNPGALPRMPKTAFTSEFRKSLCSIPTSCSTRKGPPTSVEFRRSQSVRGMGTAASSGAAATNTTKTLKARRKKIKLRAGDLTEDQQKLITQAVKKKGDKSQLRLEGGSSHRRGALSSQQSGSRRRITEDADGSPPMKTIKIPFDDGTTTDLMKPRSNSLPRLAGERKHRKYTSIMQQNELSKSEHKSPRRRTRANLGHQDTPAKSPDSPTRHFSPLEAIKNISPLRGMRNLFQISAPNSAKKKRDKSTESSEMRNLFQISGPNSAKKKLGQSIASSEIKCLSDTKLRLPLEGTSVDPPNEIEVSPTSRGVERTVSEISDDILFQKIRDSGVSEEVLQTLTNAGLIISERRH